MATVRSIVTKWGFQVDSKPLEQMKLSVAELKSGIKALGLEALGAATALFETAETTAKAGKAADLASQKTGMGVEAFQEYAFAAKKAGLDSEGFVHAMAHLNRAVFEARTGNKEAFKSFAMLGGSVASAALHGGSTESVLLRIADRMKGLKDPAAKTALAMQIFGRAGFQMLPMLNRGSEGLRELAAEAQEMGLILSKDAVRDSKAFMGSLHQVEGLIIGIKNSIGVALLAPMTKVFDSFADWIRLNRELIKQNITGFFKGLSQILMVTLKVTTIVVRRLTELAKPLGGLGAAAKYAFQAFALFQGLKILHGIGEAVVGITGFAKSIRLAVTGISTLSGAWKVLAASEFAAAVPMVLWGLAVVAVVALIEDLMGFFSGKDSLTGVIIESFGKGGKVIIGFVSDVYKFFVNFVSAMGDQISKLVSKFNIFSGLGDKFSGVFEAIHTIRYGDQDPQDKPGGFAKGPSDLSFLDQKPGMSNFGGANSSNNTGEFNVQNQITVSVGENADPHAIGEKVREAATQGTMDAHLRAAHRNLTPVVAH